MKFIFLATILLSIPSFSNDSPLPNESLANRIMDSGIQELVCDEEGRPKQVSGITKTPWGSSTHFKTLFTYNKPEITDKANGINIYIEDKLRCSFNLINDEYLDVHSSSAHEKCTHEKKESAFLIEDCCKIGNACSENIH